MKQKTKVIINGSNGRMGQAAVNAIKKSHDLELVAALTRKDNLLSAIKDTRAKVVVDLTVPDVVFEHSKITLAAGAHPVIGATGLTNENIQELQEISSQRKIGGIIAPNFSIGALLMMRFAKEAAKHFNYAEIIEMHHEQKIDSPSGTAKKTADMMAENFKAGPMPKSKETIAHTRGGSLHNIPIHAVRMPGLLAHQQVIFGEAGETFTISHDSINRDCFMPGILLACRKVLQLDQLIYGLDEVLFND